MQLGKASDFQLFVFQAKRLLLLSSVFGLFLSTLLIFKGDKNLFIWINQNLTPEIGWIAIYFSLFGEWFAMVFLFLISLWKSFRKTFAVAISWLLGACFSWIFKLWLLSGLARPFRYFSSEGIHLQLVEGVDVHNYNTFPSGHTLTAFSSLLLFKFVFSNLNGWFEMLIFCMAIGCGISRIILVQHWPADVLGGMILGLLASLMGIYLSSKLKKKPFWDSSFL